MFRNFEDSIGIVLAKEKRQDNFQGQEVQAGGQDARRGTPREGNWTAARTRPGTEEGSRDMMTGARDDPAFDVPAR